MKQIKQEILEEFEEVISDLVYASQHCCNSSKPLPKAKEKAKQFLSQAIEQSIKEERQRIVRRMYKVEDEEQAEYPEDHITRLWETEEIVEIVNALQDIEEKKGEM